MKKPPNPATAPVRLRRQAEARLQARAAAPRRGAKRLGAEADLQRLLHELQVHQVELELQNAELQAARNELEMALEKYTDLYDFAPVGYFTLNPSGVIKQLNLTGAVLIGSERSRLVGRSFPQWVATEFRPAFGSFLQRVFAGQARQSGDFELAIPGQPRRIVNIEAHRVPDGQECRAVVADIGERRQAEEILRRNEALSAANRTLELEILRRQAVETAIKQSERHQRQLLQQSQRMQKQLRRLPRQILSAQEEERKRISRELHDVVAQTLTGISMRLTSLRTEPGQDAETFDHNLDRAQRLLETVADTVHRFARELRPAVLDDLGLIPALHTFLRDFATQTGVRTRLTAAARVDRLDLPRRTVLFRVAQEALNNVARHAHANRVEVSVLRLADSVSLKIEDDGRSFNVERALRTTTGKRLGLLGMRERLEMVGGSLTIGSVPGAGTTVIAQIPLGKAPRRTEVPLRKPA